MARVLIHIEDGSGYELRYDWHEPYTLDTDGTIVIPKFLEGVDNITDALFDAVVAAAAYDAAAAELTAIE
jgi:hypothetical protein